MRLFCTGALLIVSDLPSGTLAQSTEDAWTAPLNLSNSGVALNPAMVIDSDGVVHVAWQDDLANFVLTQFDGGEWGAPEMTNLNLLFRLPAAGEPTDLSQLANYTGPNPLFIAGPSEFIFAFWISPEGRLFTSNVLNQNFGDFAAWGSGRLITADAASFVAAVDARGELHVAFLRTVDDLENQPGIYYTRSKDRGRSWAVPVLLYESPYFRRLGEGEANLSLALAGTEEAQRIYVAWDNRPRKQVLLTKSADGGKTWEQPVLVAGPAPDSGLASPYNVLVAASRNSVVLIWQSGQPGGACSQIYQSSNDEGTTWSNPQPMIEDLLGCAQSNEFVANSPEGPLFLLTKTQNQVLLSAWNGFQWSEPQAQPLLSGFEDPEIYTEVIYGCHRASLLDENLYIVGCDQGGGGDVWVTSRDLGPTTAWFTPPVWSSPLPVTEDTLNIGAVELVATGDDLIHAFFSQRRDRFIYYTRWNGDLWSPVTPVLELPEGEAGWPAIAAGPEGELFLIAPSNSGGLYFSQATSDSTITASSWSTPTQLGMGHDGEIGSVDVAWDTAGTVYVVYSVPVNEERGIYLVQSNDDGTTWSEPLQVFDGASAGSDLVGAPSLLISDNGFLHIIWKEQSIEGDGVPQPRSLYYTRSEDGGHTFSDAELIVEEPVGWREIVIDGSDNLHLLWQPQGTMTTVWDQVSIDGGRSWQVPLGLPHEGITAAVVDSAGRLHLLDAGLGSLRHWIWDGDRWQPEAPVHWALASQQDSPVDLLVTAANKQGKMVVLLGVPTGLGDVAEQTLLYSSRALELQPDQNVTEEVPTPTLLPTTLASVTPTPESPSTPTSTIESEPTSSQSQTDPNETNTGVSPLTVALLPVVLLLLGVLGIVIRRVARAGSK